MSEERTVSGPQDNALAQRFTISSLLGFAFPTIFMVMFAGLYTVVDTVFVARFVNTNALSSVNIVTPVVNLIVGLGTMLSAGGSAVIARKMGEDRLQTAREDFTLIISAAAVVGVLISGFGLLFLEQIIRGLGASDLLLPYAKDYLTLLLVFAPANILQVVFANLFVTAGKPGLGMGLGLAAGLTNALLDFIFMGPMQMGIGGAALATSMGYLLQAVAGLVYFTLNKRGTLYFTRANFDIRVLGESCLNGSSEMVSQLSAAITTFLFNRAMMRLLGEDGVAAITIMIYSQYMLTTLYLGFSIGVAPAISFNYGSGNTSQLRRIVKICIGFISVSSLAVFAGAMIGGPHLVEIFSARGTQVFEIARMGFLIFPFSFLFCGMNIYASSLFTALSNGKVSAAISFLRTFVFLVIGIIVLPLFLREYGIWLAVPLAEALTLVFSILFILRGRARYKY